MKKIPFIFLFSLAFVVKSYSQKINISDLVGIWDHNVSGQAATIIFDDTSRIRFSYKGHTGSTRKCYYYLDNSHSPAVLTVDFKPNHKKNRNVYLIQLVDKNTMKLQEIGKKDSREHFNEDSKQKIVTLIRRMDL